MNDKERAILKQNILALLSTGAPGDRDKFGEEMTSAFIQYIDGGAGAALENTERALESDAPPEKSALESIIAGGMDLTQGTAKKAIKAERQKFSKKLQQIHQRIDSASDRQEIPEDVTEYELTAYFSQFLGDETAEDIPEGETIEKAAEQIRNDRAVYDGMVNRLVKAVNGDGGPDEKKAVMLLILGEALQHVAANMGESIHQMSNAEENDTFLLEALTAHPENAAAAADISKAVLTRAARAAALYLTTCITAAVEIDPDPKKPAAEIGESLQNILSCLYDPEDTTKDVLDTLPKTLEYLREHAPELAADLEAHARREVEAAFSSLTEYVESYGREPLEGKATERLPVIRTTKATERTDTIDKITSFLPGEALYNLDSPQELAMEKRGSQNRVSAFVNIIPDDTITAEMGRLDPKDVVTLNSVYAIYMAGNNIMTERQVFDVMTGDTGKPPTKKQLEDIRARLSKMTHLGIKLDVSAEAVALGYPKGTRLVRDVNLIPGEMGVIRNINGQETSCLAIYTMPPILWYAERKGQILRYPVNMLDVGLRNTDDVIILKNYLASRVRSRLQPVILYETIYKQLGELGTTPGAIRKKKVKIRDMVKEIMEQFKKQREIKSYQSEKKRGEFYSISFVRG